MENRDVEIDDEDKDIAPDSVSQLVSEGESSVHATEVTPTDFLTALNPPLKFEILDIDGLLAAQGAANAMQVSLSGNNDRWWSDLFGEQP